MARNLGFACFLGLILATYVPAQSGSSSQQSSSQAGPTAQQNQVQQQAPDETEPPEEDETVKPRVYSYDPLEAERDIKVGQFYMHQHNDRGYRAAAGRFEDATKYDPKSAEAFFRLGEAEEKLKHKDKAEAAFRRVVALSPDSKLAKEAQKKLGHSG